MVWRGGEDPAPGGDASAAKTSMGSEGLSYVGRSKLCVSRDWEMRSMGMVRNSPWFGECSLRLVGNRLLGHQSSGLALSSDAWITRLHFVSTTEEALSASKQMAWNQTWALLRSGSLRWCRKGRLVKNPFPWPGGRKQGLNYGSRDEGRIGGACTKAYCKFRWGHWGRERCRPEAPGASGARK